MAARKWTPEQRARQSQKIHEWEPWAHSTGARTKEGKAASSKNALNYSLREISREMARTNKELLVYINFVFKYGSEYGLDIAPNWEAKSARMEALLENMKQEFEKNAAERVAKKESLGCV